MGCAGNVLGVNVRLFNIKVNYWHIYGSAIKRNRKRKWPKACSGSEDLVLQSIHKAMKFYILIKKQTNRQTKVNKEISVTLTSCKKKKKNRQKKKDFYTVFDWEQFCFSLTWILSSPQFVSVLLMTTYLEQEDLKKWRFRFIDTMKNKHVWHDYHVC